MTTQRDSICYLKDLKEDKMFEVLRKLDDGQEVLALKMTNEVSVDKDIDGKALGDMEIEMIGSTESLDRDGESIALDAWDIKQFKKNPIILPQHNYSRPAIGKAKDVRIKDGALVFKIEFPEDGVNPEADTYRKLYKAGFMNASSVGFIPKTWEDGDGKKTPFRKFTKVELLELSLVSVPSNPTALMTAKSKGIVNDAELKAIGLEVKSDDPNLLVNDNHMQSHREMAEYMEDMEEMISDIKMRLSFVEGFISGVGKSEKLEVEQDNVTLKYINDILCGEPEAKCTDEVSTVEEVVVEKSLGELLKEKSLKSYLKGE
jgi:HK97 family phage prohead protease